MTASRIHVVHSIDDRLQLIAQQIAKGETDPWLRQYAYSVVRGLPQHGRIGEEHELGAIFWHVKNNIEYRLESRNVDIYATAQKTLEIGAGDCDDHTVLICSLLSNLGWLCGAKVVSADGNGWHIYPIVGFPKNNPSQGYVALDTTQAPSVPGWEPGFPHQNNEIRSTFIRGRADSRPIRRGGRMVA